MYFLPFASCSNDGGDPAAGAGGTVELTMTWPWAVLNVALSVPELLLLFPVGEVDGVPEAL